MQLYSEILDAGGPAFGSILRHVRDSPNDGFLFHCTGTLPSSLKTTSFLITCFSFVIAGKDRTGIAAALLLLVGLVSGLIFPPVTVKAKTLPARWRQ